MQIFQQSYWTQRNTELLIGKMLRLGVVSASFITILGGIVYIFQHNGNIPDFSSYAPIDSYLREIGTIFPRVFQGDGLAIIQLGVAVLIATPVFRVAFSVVAFAIEKDKQYVIITLIVLSIILLNMFFGIEG